MWSHVADLSLSVFSRFTLTVASVRATQRSTRVYEKRERGNLSQGLDCGFPGEERARQGWRY